MSVCWRGEGVGPPSHFDSEICLSVLQSKYFSMPSDPAYLYGRIRFSRVGVKTFLYRGEFGSVEYLQSGHTRYMV